MSHPGSRGQNAKGPWQKKTWNLITKGCEPPCDSKQQLLNQQQLRHQPQKFKFKPIFLPKNFKCSHVFSFSVHKCPLFLPIFFWSIPTCRSNNANSTSCPPIKAEANSTVPRMMWPIWTQTKGAPKMLGSWSRSSDCPSGGTLNSGCPNDSVLGKKALVWGRQPFRQPENGNSKQH